MFYLAFYCTQGLTHNVPAKIESTEKVYTPVVMKIASTIVFTIMHTSLQESHHWLDLKFVCSRFYK